MIVQPQPIHVNEERESQSYRTDNRLSMQRFCNQNNEYRFTIQEHSQFRRDDIPGLGTSLPTYPPIEGLYVEHPFPTYSDALENATAFTHQSQCFDLHDETPSPPVGFSAASMRGLAASPSYPMPLRTEFTHPFDRQTSHGISYSPPPPLYENTERRQVTHQQLMCTGQFQAFLPKNQYSTSSPQTFFPTPPGALSVPYGNYSSPPPSQEFSEHRLLNPMPTSYAVDPFSVGNTQYEQKPQIISANEGSIGTDSRWVKKFWTQEKGATIQSNRKSMKTTEQGVGRQETRQSFFIKPTIRAPFCSFCKKNRETREYYESHVLRNEDGSISCPILRRYACPICKAVGDDAHTLKYCPENQDNVLSSQRRSMYLKTKLKLTKKRNSVGVIGACRYN